MSDLLGGLEFQMLGCPPKRVKVSLQEDLWARRDPHQRLLWLLQDVEVCAKHRIYLQEECPECWRRIAPLCFRARCGFCPHCGAFLGRPTGRELDRHLARGLCWIAEAVGDLLAAGADLVGPVDPGRPAYAIARAADQFSAGNIAELGRYLGIPKATVSTWTTLRTKPSLRSWLQIAYRLGLTLPDVLLRDFTIRSRSATELQAFPPPDRQEKARHDWSRIRKALRTAARDKHCPSLALLARTMGCDQATLKGIDPNLCAEIVRRSRWFRTERVRLREERKAELLEKAVRQVQAAGRTPSRREVGRLLPKAGVLRDPALRRRLKELRWVAPQDPEAAPGIA